MANPPSTMNSTAPIGCYRCGPAALVVTPSIFVCYRRADEPFAAALTTTPFGGLVGDDEVFLDPLYLRQRGLAAVRGCRLVLAVVAPGGGQPVEPRAAPRPDWERWQDLVGHRARLPPAGLAVRRTDHRRLWMRVADLDLWSDAQSVNEEADEFVELIAE